jgi:hypothetical protein
MRKTLRDRGQMLPGSFAMNGTVEWLMTGTTGTPASMATRNAVFLNQPSRPLRARVPSGKISKLLPRANTARQRSTPASTDAEEDGSRLTKSK